MTSAGIDAWTDAKLGLPPQAARRFCDHELHAGRVDWPTYVAQYLDVYYRTARETR